MEPVSEVFLSATVKDTDDDKAPYRRRAKESLEKAEVTVFLQNHWVVSFANVVDECYRRIGEASGYFGLFGFRYGWRPTPGGPSITELEFDEAWRRWKALSHPPIFVFHPSRKSKAAKELEAAADRALAKEFQKKADRAKSKADQDAFVARISGMGRIIQNFTDPNDFLQRASVAVPLYNGKLLRQGKQAEARGLIPNSDLGYIGRDKQLKALRRLLIKLAGRVPAMCVVVHGQEGWGQQELLDHLEHWPDWRSAGGPRLGRNSEDLAALLAWVTHELGETGLEATLHTVADVVTKSCEQDNTVLILQRHGLASLKDFQHEFWRPLFGRIVERMPLKKGQKHFIVVARHDSLLTPPGPKDPWTSDCAEPDFEKLVALPKCGAITLEHVQDWLFEQALPLGVGEISSIARRSTTNAKGKTDGTPKLVYQRLQDALPNWAELAAGGET